MSKALVLFSGGQDSTTCLYWAKHEFDLVEALSLNYGQRHQMELGSAKKITELAEVKHTVMEVDVLSQIADSVLLNNINSVNENHRSSDNLPASFVPGRNILLLTIAAAYAYKKGIKNIITGVCETDYSGYPDCRDNTIKSLQVTLSLAMDFSFVIHTPLMWMDKKDTVEMARNISGCWKGLAYSHTCYEGQFPPCSECPACILRAKGFDEAGYNDPLVMRYVNE